MLPGLAFSVLVLGQRQQPRPALKGLQVLGGGRGGEVNMVALGGSRAHGANYLLLPPSDSSFLALRPVFPFGGLVTQPQVPCGRKWAQ